MRFQGKLTSWNDEKGFGTITWHGSSDKLFVHISAFKTNDRRPSLNDVVTYESVKDPNGKFRAVNVAFSRIKTDKINAKSSMWNGGFFWFITIGFALYLLISTLLGHLPLAVAGYYAIASIVAFMAYWIDKNAAKKNNQRTRESTLHFMSLAGGWPGAYAAQRTFRHKTVKQPFRFIFVVTVILNLVGFAIYQSPRVAGLLKSLLIN